MIHTQETRKTHNNLNSHLNELEKIRTKPKVNRRKDKIRAEINEIETKINKKIKRLIKLRVGPLKR